MNKMLYKFYSVLVLIHEDLLFFKKIRKNNNSQIKTKKILSLKKVQMKEMKSLKGILIKKVIFLMILHKRGFIIVKMEDLLLSMEK